MKALLVKPNEHPVQIEVKSDLNSLRSAIGVNYIEIYHPFDDWKVAIVCDEEGKLNGAKLCRILIDSDAIVEYLFGAFLILGEGAEDFKSLSANQITKYAKMFTGLACKLR